MILILKGHILQLLSDHILPSMMPVPYSNEIRQRIVYLDSRNLTTRAIKERLLADDVRVTQRSIRRVIQRYRKRGTVLTKKPNRPLTPRQKRLRALIEEVFERDDRATSVHIQREYMRRYGKTLLLYNNAQLFMISLLDLCSLYAEPVQFARKYREVILLNLW